MLKANPALLAFAIFSQPYGFDNAVLFLLGVWTLADYVAECRKK